jgi:hypothetical protein
MIVEMGHLTLLFCWLISGKHAFDVNPKGSVAGSESK